MKANAPKKLYLSSTGKLSDGISTGRLRDTDIEYTRTGAFVKSVANWMSDTLQTVSEVETPSALRIITQTEFIEKFKKEIMFYLD